MADADKGPEAELRADLKSEYGLLQKTYEDFDQRSLTIKGWVAAAAVAGATLGLKDGHPAVKEVWVVVVVVLTSIWCVETYWKMFQYGFRDRIRILEAFFRGDVEAPPPFQIYHWWYEAYANDRPIYPKEKKFRPHHIVRRYLAVMFFPFVFLPYLPLIVVCLTVYFDLDGWCVAIASFAVAAVSLTGYFLFAPRPDEEPAA